MKYYEHLWTRVVNQYCSTNVNLPLWPLWDGMVSVINECKLSHSVIRNGKCINGWLEVNLWLMSVGLVWKLAVVLHCSWFIKNVAVAVYFW